MKASDKKYSGALMMAAVLLVAGWELFYFLTDDAFIAFRYISQRQLGHGYTWNAPPWLPIEGYTSFAWIVLLDAIWTLSGIEPPAAANFLSLFCSLGSLLVYGYWARGVLKKHHPAHSSPALFGLALLALVTQRVFLTWTSSGLETALFNLLVLSWTWAAFHIHRQERHHQWWLAALAAGMALTRPDGYLFAAATLVILALHGWRKKVPFRDVALRSSPLLAVLLHVLWRRSYYGEWLPNTYYAKVVGPLPDLGLAYLASFILEHAGWLWLLVVGAGIFRAKAWNYLAAAGPRALALGALTAHLLFYTVVAGGDHFEYRTLSHLVPLLGLALLWAVLALAPKPRTAGLLFVFTWLISSLIPWVHWSVCQEHTKWTPTMPSYPVAPELPSALQSYGATFDELQQWLFGHGVGMRHQQHKLFYDHQRKWVPSRAEAAQIFGDEPNPTVLTTGARVTGWSFPEAHIIDFYGLNDYVVARTRPYEQNLRIVAHARRPPPGYVEALRPNMTVTPTQITDFKPRDPPMQDQELRAIEARFRAALPPDRNLPKVYRPEGK